MASEHIPVIDCDGHLIESAQELLEFVEPVDRESTLSSDRRWGIFPSLDGFHYPRGPRIGEAPKREYVQASEHRRGFRRGLARPPGEGGGGAVGDLPHSGPVGRVHPDAQLRRAHVPYV